MAQQDAAMRPSAGQHARSRCSLPENPQVFGTAMPSVIKATAIVNGDVITQTDIDQRLALAGDRQRRPDPGRRGRAAAPAGAAQPDRRNAPDPGRQGREDRDQDSRISTSTVARVAGNVKQTPDQLAAYLEAQRLLDPDRCAARSRAKSPGSGCSSAKIESGVSVGDDEVKAVLDKLNASKGTEEYHVGEIFLSATPATETADPRQCQQDPRAAAQRRIVRRLCPAIFGSLDRGGRRRPRLGPPRAAARRRSPPRFAQMRAGHGQQPDPGPGRRFDPRGPGHPQDPDRRSARRGAQPQAGLGQLPQGHDAASRPSRSSPASPQAAQNVGGCGGADKIAADFNGEVVQQRPGQAARPAAGAAADDAADAGRPGDPAVRLARGRRARAGDLRPRRGRPDGSRASTRSTTRSTRSGSTCAPAATCATFAAMR